MNNNTLNKKITNTFFFILLFIFLYLGYLMFFPYWQIIIFSIMIAIVANPIHKKIGTKIRNENIAALVSTFFIFSFILIPGLILTIAIVQQSLSAIPAIIKFISQTKDFDYYIQNIPIIGQWYPKVKIIMQSSGVDLDLTGFAKDNAGTFANFILEKGKGLLTNVGIGFGALIFILLTIFFLFRDGQNFYKGLYEIIPMSEKDKTFLFEKSYQATKAIFLGTILTALVQAILSFIAYFFAGTPYSLFWGFATFVTAFIPLGGAAIIWFPLALYSFYSSGIITGIIFLVWGAVIVSGSDNIVRPLLIGGQTNINTLILVFTILGGVDLFGFIGIFIAPVIIVLIDNLLLLYKEKYLNISTFDENINNTENA